MQTSPRTQRILEYLESVRQEGDTLFPDALMHLVNYVVSLPEEYQVAGLQAIANSIASLMHMHMLGLIEMFQRNAEQEGISANRVTKRWRE